MGDGDDDEDSVGSGSGIMLSGQLGSRTACVSLCVTFSRPPPPHTLLLPQDIRMVVDVVMLSVAQLFYSYCEYAEKH